MGDRNAYNPQKDELLSKHCDDRLDRAVQRIEHAAIEKALSGVIPKTVHAPYCPPAPTRATSLPNSAQARKEYPIIGGVLDYFPDAIAAIAHLSYVGNQQHNPGEPLHWDRSKSTDDIEAMGRHILQRGGVDTDGVRHTTKAAWRLLAVLQKEIEADLAKNQCDASAGKVPR